MLRLSAALTAVAAVAAAAVSMLAFLPSAGARPAPRVPYVWIETMRGMIRIATMFVILIIGLIAGPAVSL